ncbi:MAG: hypothetical protein QOJ79_87 [Actinomycetota bacterium]|jgi:hypothetical protein|nr:hypothetical protein [Actinomycetota bacterium]
MRRRGRLAAVAALAVVAGFASSGLAAPTPAGSVRLGPLLRVQTPGGTPVSCPFESEPEIAHTAAGTWVAYNDDSGCPLIASQLRLTGLQLLPANGGPRRYINLPQAWKSFGYYSGDPDLTPDPQSKSGVLLASLIENDQGLQVGVVRVSPSGRASLLPSPSLSTSDDKEFIAGDLGPHSKYRGRSYLAWDDVAHGTIVVRAFDGHQWLPAATVDQGSGYPDVSVAPNGDVAVAYVSAVGVTVRTSLDGGRTFGDKVSPLRGNGPGRDDPSCPLRPTIAQRQRAMKGPHVAWDSRGRLHVIASLSTPGLGLETGSVGAGTGGEGTVFHAVSADRGFTFSKQLPVSNAETSEVQWAPAIAVLPDGGVAVSYLQTAQTTSYDALIAVQPAGATRFGSPVLLSEGHGPLPAATEAVGNSNCYGIGDYTGLAPTPDGVVADWPTTVGVQTSYVDSDIAVRQVHVTS